MPLFVNLEINALVIMIMVTITLLIHMFELILTQLSYGALIFATTGPMA